MAWTLPTPYVLQQIRRLRGGAKVTYPECDTKGKRVERVLICSLADVPLAYGTADVDFTDCKLVYQEMLGQDFQNAEVYRRYENGYTDATEISELVGETTHEWGVAQTKQQRVPYGTAASSGFTVWQSVVQPESKTRAVKTTLEYPVASPQYPTFRDWEYDHTMGATIALDKTIVLPTTMPTVAGEEIRQIDAWRSIQIVPRLDLSTLPSQSWKVVTRDSFPAETTSVQVVATGVQNQVISGATCNVTTKSAYSGSVAGEIYRTFSTAGPPANVESPTVFYPQSHHYNAAAAMSWVGTPIPPTIPDPEDPYKTIPNPDYNSAMMTQRQMLLSGSSAMIANDRMMMSVSIPESLHPSFTLGVTLYFSITMVGSITMFIDYGTIPATTPTALPHGSKILRSVDTSPWRFGVWVTEKLYVVVP